MKILLLHNRYQIPGGEDTVFRLESELLKTHGQETFVYEEDNSAADSKSLLGRLKFVCSSIYNYEVYKRYSKVIEEVEPDIIHVHNFFFTLSPSIFWVASKKNIPVVFTLHNFRLVCPNALLFRDSAHCDICVKKFFKFSSVIYKCYRDSYIQSFVLWMMIFINKIIGTWRNKISGYICLTDFSKKIYCNSSMNVNKSKFYLKPNFVEDPGELDIVRKDQFIYIGRLSREKGINILIAAIPLIDKSKKVIIVGKGPYLQEVEKTAAKHQNLKYLGFRDHSECIKLLGKSAAQIFPSTCFEGFPMTILEAFSTGTPVISSDIGNQASIIRDGINGLHFRNDDPMDLARAINKFTIQENKSLYSNCRKEYLEKYTPEQNYRIVMNIYKEIIRKNSVKTNR